MTVRLESQGDFYCRGKGVKNPNSISCWDFLYLSEQIINKLSG